MRHSALSWLSCVNVAGPPHQLRAPLCISRCVAPALRVVCLSCRARFDYARVADHPAEARALCVGGHLRRVNDANRRAAPWRTAARRVCRATRRRAATRAAARETHALRADTWPTRQLLLARHARRCTHRTAPRASRAHRRTGGARARSAPPRCEPCCPGHAAGVLTAHAPPPSRRVRVCDAHGANAPRLRRAAPRGVAALPR